MEHLVLDERGITAATVLNVPFLKLVLVADWNGKVVLDCEQLRWLVEDAGPRLLAALDGS